LTPRPCKTRSATPSAIAIHQVQTQPQAPRLVNDKIHPSVEFVILKSLQKQREERYGKASEMAKDLIQAATLAFRSGFTAPPAPPIAAPDIEPEFAAADETEGDQAQIAIDADPISVGQIVSDEATLAEEVRAPVTVPDIEATTILPPGDQLEAVPDLKATIPITKGRGGAKARTTRRSRADSKPSVSERAPKLDPPSVPALADKGGVPALSADVSIVEQTEPAPLAEPLELPSVAKDATTKIDADENMADIFAEAELRLDEILVDHSQDTHIKEAIETETKQQEGDSTLSEQQPISLTSSADEALPSFDIALEKRGRGRSAMLAAVFAVGLLIVFGLIGVAAWTFYSAGGKTTQSPTQPLTQNSRTTEVPPGMALVPGGEFMMGSDTGDEYARPAHQVSVRPFYMDLTEVTNEAYKKFVDETRHAPPPGWKKGTYPAGQAKFPVTGINWDDATAYAKWAGKRLPTEEEWEFAARGTDGRIYPWGNDWGPGLANAGNNAKGHHGMAEVGEHTGKSPFGMLDMAGNAWEWTSSDAKAYPGGEEFVKDSRERRVIRGGYWGSDRKIASSIGRAAYGVSGAPGGYPNTGIRCVKDVGN
jgi:formylglycine-generating enzyme required for sulfatase activity